MRGTIGTFVLGGVIAWMAPATPSDAQLVDPAPFLAQTRDALGGQARLAAIRTFVVTGRTRQVRGNNLVPIEFEIQAELPDKYARRDEFPAQDAGPSTTGFNGDRLIQMPAPQLPPVRPGAPGPNPAQQQALARARVIAAKQDFARLMLGVFATSLSSVPLTFRYVGEAEAPQGHAHVIDAAGPASFLVRLFIAADTHLPIMITWQQPAPAAARGSATQGAPPASVEHRLYFADFRAADGLMLPFRIRHAVAGETTEETTFDRFRINVHVDQKRFEPIE